MNAILPFAAGQVPAAFRNRTDGNELGAGIQSSFGIISYRGKVWATKYQGNEQALMRDDGDGPRASIDVVIIKAAPVIAKIFYEQGFVDGSNAPPDCFSTNGMAPDPASPKKQSPTCAGCPRNAWGSKTTEAGKPGKACADSKRLAVVPLADIDNEALGGPMLLRVPAASLKDIKGYGEMLQSYGYPYYAVATKISFDHNEAFPKFVLQALRPLTDEEAAKVAALQADPRVDRILSSAVDMVAHEPAQPAVPATPFVQQPQAPAPAPVQPTPAPVQPAVVQQAQPVAEAPVVQQTGFGAAAPAAPKRTRRTKAQIEADNLAAQQTAQQNQNSTAPANPPSPQQTSGFGATAPVTAAGPVVPPQAQVHPAPVQPAAAPAPESFDQLLDELLPQQ